MHTAAVGKEGFREQTATLLLGTPARFHTGDEFRLFPTRIEVFVLRFSWLLVLAPALILSIASSWIEKMGPGVFAVTAFPGTAYYLTQGAFAVACLLVAYWSSCIPGAFRVLLENAESRVSAEEQRAFLRSYSTMLHSNGRYVLIALYVLASGVFLVSVDWMLAGRLPAVITAQDFALWLMYVVWFPGFVLLAAGFTGACAWAMIVTAIFTNRSAEIYGIRVCGNHRDGCGGLEPLSQFCLASALPLIASGLLAAIVGSHLVDLGFRDQVLEAQVRLVARITFIWNAVISVFIFILPVWKVHLRMLEKRRAHQDKLASRIERLSARIERCLEADDLSGATTAKEWLSVLDATYSRQDWPVWPISRDIRLKFVGGQVFSAIPIVLKAVSEVGKVL
jgi:hypothetical protein